MNPKQKELAALFEAFGSHLPTMRRLALQVSLGNPDSHAQIEAAIDLYAGNAKDGRFAFDAIEWSQDR